MRVRILSSALADLRNGRQFYENQEEGAGDYFYDSLFSNIDALKTTAGIHRKVFGFHRLLAKRFPYAVYYKVRDDEMTVYRVLDCRRNPQAIRDALI
ncbi:MAG TPA: type II toxin-antitoxin system RelE/ParE family toxin [Verrucomicrobiales bacterium]|nr:type II toxin-antitoxin system RelE/ParE family toxin [Verrucomicrobiales bacterium]